MTLAARRSGRAGTAIPLLVVAAVCWAAVVWWMGLGAGGGPGADPGPIGLFLAAWTLMMAAMMLPSVWPVVLVYRRLRAGREETGRHAGWAGAALLLAGYLSAWLLAGLAGFVVLVLGRAWAPDVLRWDRGGPLLAGGVIVAAAVYQLSPLKDVCLRRCRGPFSFLLEHWRPGPSGAVRMGVRHGLWCIGCCWALMAALFALGAMSVGWMALIALFIAAEKLLPWRRTATTVVTVALLALGIAVAVAPDRVPGLGSAAGTPMQEPGMPGMDMSHG